MFIQDLGQKFVTDGLGSKGVNLFIGEFPPSATKGLNIIAAPSPEPHKTGDLFYQTVDIWSTHAKSLDAYAKIMGCFNAYHKKFAYTIGGYHVYFSYAMGMPDDLGSDNNNRKMYKLTMQFIYRPN